MTFNVVHSVVIMLHCVCDTALSTAVQSRPSFSKTQTKHDVRTSQSNTVPASVTPPLFHSQPIRRRPLYGLHVDTSGNN